MNKKYKKRKYHKVFADYPKRRRNKKKMDQSVKERSKLPWSFKERYWIPNVPLSMYDLFP